MQRENKQETERHTPQCERSVRSPTGGIKVRSTVHIAAARFERAAAVLRPRSLPAVSTSENGLAHAQREQ